MDFFSFNFKILKIWKMLLQLLMNALALNLYSDAQFSHIINWLMILKN